MGSGTFFRMPSALPRTLVGAWGAVLGGGAWWPGSSGRPPSSRLVFFEIDAIHR